MDKVQLAYEEYKENLIPFIWSFEYEDGEVNELRFEEEDFVHLIGLDKLKKYSIMRSKKIPGIASICLKDLKKEKITDALIKKDRNRRLVERRINHFEKLSILIDDPSTQHFDFDKNLVPCKINAEYMLYNPLENIHCHFGTIETRITKGSVPKKYSPITWFIEDDRPDMYIKGQKPLKLKEVKKWSKEDR